MPRAFAEISFTPTVKTAQQRYGSREQNLGFEFASDGGKELGARESQFIAMRDNFYLATVSETGWPYVQHKGGPVGFVKVLDKRTIAFPDFRGNVQYLSVGNLIANDRVSVLLMDYAHRRRLKIWGRSRIVHENEDRALIAMLQLPSYRARMERAIVIHVEALDWNCPQHITPRFTQVELDELLAPVTEHEEALGRQIETKGAPRG